LTPTVFLSSAEGPKPVASACFSLPVFSFVTLQWYGVSRVFGAFLPQIDVWSYASPATFDLRVAVLVPSRAFFRSIESQRLFLFFSLSFCRLRLSVIPGFPLFPLPFFPLSKTNLLFDWVTPLFLSFSSSRQGFGGHKASPTLPSR